MAHVNHLKYANHQTSQIVNGSFTASYRTLKSFTPDYRRLRNVETTQGMESYGIYIKQNMLQNEYYA